MRSLRLLAALLLSSGSIAAADPPSARLIEAKRIWDQAPHSAFTDLAYWKYHFVCAFREGRGHESTDGTIRVLTSSDGGSWTSAAVIAMEGFDLRDAGLCIAPDGRLMLVGGAAPRKIDGETAPTGSFVSFSKDAAAWSQPKIVIPPGRWMWRVTWLGGKAYGVSYAASDGHPFTSLLTSDDGIHYREYVPKLCGDGYPTEATLRFDDAQTLFCLQRRDHPRPPQNSALLGISQPPYTDWQWHDLKIYFGGPNFIQISDGRWIAAGRVLRDDGPKTEVAWLDVDNKTLRPILQLPSGGDTSYPGLVWTSASYPRPELGSKAVEPHDGTLWVSYYSSHEGKASIYLAKVRIE